MVKVGRPRKDIKKEPMNIAVNPDVKKSVSELAVKLDTSASNIAEKMMEERIMDYNEYATQVDSWINEFKTQGKPFCRTCAVRDFHTGNTRPKEYYSEVCGEPKRIRERTVDAIKPNQSGIPIARKVIIGIQVDYKCDEDHRVGVLFDPDEFTKPKKKGGKVGKTEG